MGTAGIIAVIALVVALVAVCLLMKTPKTKLRLSGERRGSQVLRSQLGLIRIQRAVKSG